MRIIFLHGFPDNPEVWRYCVEHLQGKAICRTPELHSLKFEAQIQRVLEMSEDQQVILVGHDIGGALATEFAARFPEKVSRVILINSIGLTMFAHRLRMLEQLLRSSYISVFLNPFVNRFTLAPVSKWLLKLIYDLGKLPADDRLRTNGPEVLDGLARFKELAWMIPKKVFEPDEPLIVPVDIVLCDNDPVHMKPTMEELKRFFRQSELHTLAAGHWPMRTEREAFHALMDKILGQIKE
jgi:pimeloyl-ACP methyl ester carboxylesterase